MAARAQPPDRTRRIGESRQIIVSTGPQGIGDTSLRDRRRVMQSTQNRRRFLTTLSSAGAAGLIGVSDALAQQAPPETTTIRLAKYSSICVAPYSAADQLLRAEGFTDIRYVPTDAESGVPIASLTRG